MGFNCERGFEQCQGVKPLIIDEVTKIEKLKLEDYDLVIVPYECEDEYTLKNLLRKQAKELKSVLYIVGPEVVLILKR